MKITVEQQLKMHRKASRDIAIENNTYMIPQHKVYKDKKKEKAKKACRNFKW